MLQITWKMVSRVSIISLSIFFLFGPVWKFRTRKYTRAHPSRPGRRQPSITRTPARDHFSHDRWTLTAGIFFPRSFSLHDHMYRSNFLIIFNSDRVNFYLTYLKPLGHRGRFSHVEKKHTWFSHLWFEWQFYGYMYFGSNNELGCEELILVTEKKFKITWPQIFWYSVEHALTKIKTFEHQSCEHSPRGSVWFHELKFTVPFVTTTGE